MPLYFYHVRSDASLPDDIGVDLCDMKAAQREAVRFTTEALRDEQTKFLSAKHWHLDVTDEAGLVLFQVEVSLTEALRDRQRTLDEAPPPFGEPPLCDRVGSASDPLQTS